MNRSLVIAVTGALLLSLFGCAYKPGNEDAYQATSENCSDKFVADVNHLSNAGKAVRTRIELYDFEEQVNEFEKKYRDVSCKAVIISDSGERDDYIDANDQIRKWREAIAQATRPAPPL